MARLGDFFQGAVDVVRGKDSGSLKRTYRKYLGKRFARTARTAGRVGAAAYTGGTSEALFHGVGKSNYGLQSLQKVTGNKVLSRVYKLGAGAWGAFTGSNFIAGGGGSQAGTVVGETAKTGWQGLKTFGSKIGTTLKSVGGGLADNLGLATLFGLGRGGGSGGTYVEGDGGTFVAPAESGVAGGVASPYVQRGLASVGGNDQPPFLMYGLIAAAAGLVWYLWKK